MLKLRLVSDGVHDTHLETEDGETLDIPIRRVSWEHQAGSLPRITMEIEVVEAFLVGSLAKTDVKLNNLFAKHGEEEDQ